MRSFVCIVWIAAALSAAAANVTLELSTAAAGLRCEVSALALKARDGSTSEIRLAAPVVVSDASASLQVDVDKLPVEVTPVAEGCWAAPQLVEDAPAPAALQLWPSAVVIGAMSFREKAEPPRIIAGSFVDTSGKGGAAVECTLERELWRCVVPAVRPLHLKVAVDDFAPAFVWDINVAPATIHDSGIHPLVRGGAIVGRVVVERDRPATNAAVRLLPVTQGHQSEGDRTAKTLRTRSTASGHFQFTGLEPGVYRLVSSVDGRGDAVVESIDVRAGEHLELREALFHAPLAELALLLAPPVSPSQKPWSVHLFRRGTRDSELVSVANTPASVDGSWSKDALQPGTYQLRISTAEGSHVVSREIILRGGREQVTVDASMVGVTGKLLAGDRGVAADITFDLNGRRVVTRSDADGAFRADFPDAGAWRPSVTIGAAKSTLEPVEISFGESDDLVLRMPGGAVRGKVLDENGRESANVFVTLLKGIRQIARTHTDDDGKFELIGVAAGDYTIAAEADDKFAGPLPLEVQKDDAAEIQLRLESWKEVTGVVTTAAGAAASGAVVRTFDPLTGIVDDTIADARGAFSLKVKPRIEVIELVVLAPPHPIAMRRLALGERRVTSTRVQLAAVGTKLRVYIPQSPPWPILTAPDGVPRSLGLMLMPRFGGGMWRELVAGGFNFIVEPGPYVICGEGSPPCQQLQLAAHAETTVVVHTTPPAGAK